MNVVKIIKTAFAASGSPAEIPKLMSGSFRARLTDEGIKVDNLSTQPFLPWTVFEEVVSLLVQKGGRARRGDAMKFRLGDPGLPVDSVEGHVARAVYDKQLGDSVFRRITPIACILIWAGICEAAPGELVLWDSA